ncbi:MAG: hypothetical protein CR991_06380 [Proteobacteria bacterium]|nr:MAG: hypothetical protein CR991_06380 [Pseudomonadota bacterium]
MKFSPIVFLFFFLFMNPANAEFRGCTAQYSDNERLQFFGQCVRDGVEADRCASKSCCEHLTKDLAAAQGVCGFSEKSPTFSRQERFALYVSCVSEPDKDNMVNSNCCEHLTSGDVNILGDKTDCGKKTFKERVASDLDWIEETGDRIINIFNKWF